MNAELPREIHRHSAGVGVAYELPVRPLGSLRWVGLIPLVFGVVFVWGSIGALVEQISRLIRGAAQGLGWFPLLFELPFVIAGLVPVAIGLFILMGRCRLVLRDRQLQATETAGLFRWTRRIPQKSIRKLEVAFTLPDESSSAAAPATPGPWAQFGVLMAHRENAKPRVVLIGYPRTWLLALARELSPMLSLEPNRAPVPVEETTATASTATRLDEVREQPVGSTVRLEKHGHGITLLLPPLGLWKGSKGLFGFAVLWCGFMTVFTLGIFLASFEDQQSGNLVLVAFATVFWCIGLAMLAVAINLGRRRALIVVENGALRIAQVGLFGPKRWEWRREDIAVLRTDRSGVEINHRPVIELQIHPRRGQKAGLFGGRDEQELRWIATVLREALGIGATP